jgi:acetyl-CoA acetyltransferase
VNVAARRVAIVGAALSDIGRVDHKTAFELHFQGASRALADAGLTKDDVGAFMSCGLGTMAPIEVTEYLGLRPTWIDSTQVGGASWEFMVEHAYAAIAQGLTDVVVIAYGSTTRADLKRKLRTANLAFSSRGPSQFDAPFGHALIAKYAMTTRRHMHEFGTKIEQLAEIAVSARYNASLNPDAYYRDPITIDDVLGGRFCKKGEGGPFVEDGKLRVGGALPTNTDGGGLSHCHPGMRGMFLLVEAARQLRGECGPRQVPNARLACVSGTGGWFSSASTVILGTD